MESDAAVTPATVRVVGSGVPSPPQDDTLSAVGARQWFDFRSPVSVVAWESATLRPMETINGVIGRRYRLPLRDHHNLPMLRGISAYGLPLLPARVLAL